MISGVYAKFYAAVTAGAIAWATLVTTSDVKDITSEEWVTGLGYLVAAIAVFVVPNARASE